MLDFIRTRIRQGTRTLQFPDCGVDLPQRFRGLPVLEPGAGRLSRSVEGSGALATTRDGQPAIDVGACLFTPEDAGPTAFTHDYRMASRTREGLVTGTGEIELTQALDTQMRRLFRRSLRLRSVVAGSCGGCEAELVALGNVVFDIARFGVQFVASPRHADGLVITGAVSRNMRIALEKTYEAIPAPRIVIAVGACAIAGGPFAGSSQIEGGVPPAIPVDLYVPGCPPHPLTLLDGLVRLLGRMPPEKRYARRRGPGNHS